MSFSNVLRVLTAPLIFAAATVSSLAAETNINTPLTDAHWRFIYENQPILIVPQCSAYTFPCKPNADNDRNPKNNYANMKSGGVFTNGGAFEIKVTPSAKSEIQVDYDETGILTRIVYNYYRIYSDSGMFAKHEHDTESVSLTFLKDEVKDSFAVGINNVVNTLLEVETNSHGIGIMLAGSEEFIDMIGNDYSGERTAYLSAVGRIQAQGGPNKVRVVDLSLGRPVIYSEPKSNALVPVSHLASLPSELNASTTYIFYGVMNDNGTLLQPDLKALKAQFPNATYIAQTIDREEMLKWIVEEELANPGCILSMGPEGKWNCGKGKYTDFYDNEVEMLLMGTEFLDSDGDASGANIWAGWGKKPFSSKAKAYKDDRFPRGSLAEVARLGYSRKIATTDQLKQGAYRPVRSLLMRPVSKPEAKSETTN